MTKIVNDFNRPIIRARFLLIPSYKRTNPQGKFPIYIRVSVQGKRKDFSSSFYLEKGQFENGAIVHNGDPILESYQLQLTTILQNLVSIETDLRSKGIPLSPDKIIRTLKQNNWQIPTFLEVVNLWLKEQESLIGVDFIKASYNKKATVCAHIKEFVCEKLANKYIELSEIKVGLLEQMIVYLKTEKGLARESVRKFIGTLKSILNWAVIHEYISANPILPFKMKPGLRRVIQFLTIEQIIRLNNFKFESIALERCKDVFLFQCFTGLAYIDTKRLSREHLHIDSERRFWIRIPRQKTQTLSMIPVVPEALIILQKYERSSLEVDKSISSAGILPVYANAVYNRMLKQIGLMVGIEPQLMKSHTARKSFATNVLNQGVVSIETVSAMLGHSSIRITQDSYGRVGQKKIGSEMKDFSFIPSANIAS